MCQLAAHQIKPAKSDMMALLGQAVDLLGHYRLILSLASIWSWKIRCTFPFYQLKAVMQSLLRTTRKSKSCARPCFLSFVRMKLTTSACSLLQLITTSFIIGSRNKTSGFVACIVAQVLVLSTSLEKFSKVCVIRQLLSPKLFFHSVNMPASEGESKFPI